MTKNHILIKSVALGVLLMLSPFAKAADGVNRSQVEYFNKLYKTQSPKCFIPEATKARIIAGLEDKCLIRTTSNNESYISGIKPACTEASVKASADLEVNALCVNTAQQAEQATIAKQAAAAQQQQNAAKSGNGGSSSGAGVDPQALGQMFNAMATTATTKGKDGKTIYENGKEAVKDGWKKVTGQSKEENAKTTNSTTTNTEKPAASTSSVVDGAPSSTTQKYPTQDGGYVSAEIKDDGTATLTKYGSDGKAQPNNTTSISTENLENQVKSMGGDVNKPMNGNEVPGLKKAVSEAPKDVKPAAEKAADGSAATGSDAALAERKAKAEAEDQALDTEIQAMKTQLEAAKKLAPNEANEKCNANEATRDPYTGQTKNPALEKECNIGEPQQAIICLETNLQELEAAKIKLKEQKESCSSSSGQAEKLCSMVRSEKAQQVQQVMSLGATVLSKVTAASEACGTTSSISKIAQGGMLAAQGACTAMKFRCDMSCASAKKTIELMKTKAELIQKCKLTLQAIASSGSQAQQAATRLSAKLEQELTPEKSVPSAITQCKNHKLDMATMGLAALGFLSAFQDAEKCKEQLASGGGGGNGSSTSGMAGPQMTTAEYCSQPQNAASITCKCTANPNAEGCTGSLMNSGVALGKINANGGLSGFASAKQNGLSSLNSTGKSSGDASSEPPPGAGLSEAAREALGINSAAGAGGAGITGNFGSGSENSKAAAKDEKEKPKFGFFSSLGAMLSGGKSANQAAKAAIRNYEQDQAIKRKVASDQLRAEITTASGKSNFDKISNRYRESASSFEK
ncbi:hypothetical protein [Pseudobdellovibrio sp. HCB154]|uniref:hypothetical protein n=1 Tax=Pseudobdellovibrio sp. HCB154 TaxID=3386277 RepID=UPI0039176473